MTLTCGRLRLTEIETDRQDLLELVGGLYYPNRLAIGKPALFTDVNTTSHTVKTSPVNKITLSAGKVTVRTENTMYYFGEAD